MSQKYFVFLILRKIKARGPTRSQTHARDVTYILPSPSVLGATTGKDWKGEGESQKNNGKSEDRKGEGES